jgi:hypothetical protein
LVFAIFKLKPSITVLLIGLPIWIFPLDVLKSPDEPEKSIISDPVALTPSVKTVSSFIVTV